MSICKELISAAPLGSEKAKAKVWAEPLPELGVTETTVGGPLLAPPLMVSPALVL